MKPWTLLCLLGAAACVRGQDAVFVQGPLTLDSAIRLALERNPQIKVDSFDTPIARANLLAQWGQFDPALQFQRSYQTSYSNLGANYAVDPSSGELIQIGAPQLENVQVENYSLGVAGLSPWGLQYFVGANANELTESVAGQNYPEGYQSFAGVTVTQPLLRGFGLAANLQGVRVARANKGIAEWTYRQTVIDTVTNVIDAYSDLELARDNLRITEESRQLAANQLAENEQRFKVGSMSQSDVIQARSQESSDEEPVLIARRAVIDSENVLRALLGQPKFSPNAAPLAIAAMPERDEAISPDADLQRAYDLRPDYQSARLNVRKFQINQAAAFNQLLPQVNFVGGYGYNGLANSFQQSRAMVYDHDSRSYSAGLEVSVPFTFAQGRGQYRSARLQRRQAEANLKVLEQAIALSVSEAAGQVETTGERIVTARKAYAVGEQALEDEQKKLRAGYSSTFVVLQLQEEMIALEGRVAQALADHRRAIAAYDHEIGTTLERNHVTLARE